MTEQLWPALACSRCGSDGASLGLVTVWENDRVGCAEMRCFQCAPPKGRELLMTCSRIIFRMDPFRGTPLVLD